MESFTIRNLTFRYPGRQNPALSGISLAVRQGQFITLCGPSGCGKTTLLRQLKPALAPHGEKTGEILFEGSPLGGLTRREQSEKIGFVLQNPETQLVTDKVWHELAFGLESLGYENGIIRLRTAEMASFFGIETWFHKNVTELSGGQKQLLNLASIMAMQPSALILDEPTSQLDPIAAADFLAAVGKINRELGVTVILTEHRLEEVFPYSDRVVCMESGEIICDGDPHFAGRELLTRGHAMFLAMPTPMRVFAGVPNTLDCPVTVRDGRKWLGDIIGGGAPVAELAPHSVIEAPRDASIELHDVWFRYEKESQDVLKGLTLRAYPGELLCVVGGNGTGKTTALSVISGFLRPYRGRALLFGESTSDIPDDTRFGVSGDCLLGVLPQNPQSLFVMKTVREDLMEIFSGRKMERSEKETRLSLVARLCRIVALLDVHPYDLSGGEQQRAALAKVLLLRPRILLLDEPTKGLDAEFKRVFAAILRKLQRSGVTIVAVSHDIEFCAEYADRCAMFFDGAIVSDAPPRSFFSGNSFYTTSANRMARGYIPLAVTVNDMISALGGAPDNGFDGGGMSEPQDGSGDLYAPASAPERKPKRRLPLQRIILAALAAALFIATAAAVITNISDFRAFISGGGDAERALGDSSSWRYATMLLLLCAAASAVPILLSPRAAKRQKPVLRRAGRLSKRTRLAAVMILLMIPLTIFIGYNYLGDRKYLFISLLVILEAMLPFALIFEGSRPQAREIAVLAVICAIGVAGRAAFFMLPQFKPVTAIAIIAGAAFGCEAGFLTGASIGFLSGMLFSPGPWTPWQMFAFGIIGFLAGLFFRGGGAGKAALCAFGGLSTLLIYGGIMNSAMVLMYQSNPNIKMFLLMIVQGIPFDLIHAAATVTFLLIIARPLLEKLERIKEKYGLIG